MKILPVFADLVVSSETELSGSPDMTASDLLALAILLVLVICGITIAVTHFAKK